MHLVVVAPTGDGVRVTVTGVGAAQTESLAPLAARIRRALGRDGGLGGTSPFEDAVFSLLDVCQAPPRVRHAVVRLGPRCPAAPALRAMPSPADVLATARAALIRATGSVELARRLQALARAFVALAPCPPTTS